MFRVLSIDGGGIRGIIPALVLAEIEQRTGRPIADTFDLVAGTSTGGILALGLTVPGEDGRPRYAAADLVRFYLDQGPRVFSRSLWRRITGLENLLEEKYPSEPIEQVLQEVLGDARLSDALAPVLVTSYDIERRQPFFFKSHRAGEPGRDVAMWQAARATSAAPTYFEPERIDLEGGPRRHQSLVDGGVFANNPAMCAYVESQDPRFFDPEDDVVLLSLGTGELTRPIPHEDAVGWGLAQWAQPLLGVVFDGVSDAVDYQLRTVLGRDRGRGGYWRLQLRLDEGSDDIDDASRTNLRVLQQKAEQLVADSRDELDDLLPLLVPSA